MPESTVIPVLHYSDVRGAVAWLCNAFGFIERLRIGNHRAQLDVAPGTGGVVVAHGPTQSAGAGGLTHSVMIRIADVDDHCARAEAAGGRIVSPPATYPYGERQYSVVDPGGHVWTFSQTVASVHPGAWGGVLIKEDVTMARKLSPFLMFEGQAEEAMRFYVSLFHGSEVIRLERYGPGEPGTEGSVRRADFVLAGQAVICIDSPVKHAFTFTPSMSFFAECESEAEFDAAFGRLSEKGTVLMPSDNYGFSRKFGWVNDRFGVSWQLNLQ